jgi:hypothetical protein
VRIIGRAVGNIIATIMTSQSAMNCRAWPTVVIVISVVVWLCQIKPAHAAAASAKSKPNMTLR